MGAGKSPALSGAEKPRVLILTDIGEDPDDQQSLVRFLLYSCQVDVEGIIATTSVWMRGNDEMHPGNPAPGYIYQIIDGYAQVEENLRTHAEKYPPAAGYLTAAELRKTVYAGNSDHRENQIFGMDDVGIGLDSPGSNHIIDVLNKNDQRDIWILVWGGANTLAQAILDISNSNISDKKQKQLFSRIRVYDIAGQDDAGGWIAYHHPEIMYLRSRFQYRGMAYHSCYEHGKEYAIYRSEECPPNRYCCLVSDDQGGNPDIFNPG
jgi:hypothetical protein